MLRAVVLFVIFIALTSTSRAQIRATTESGNKVLLYDDRTWKYEEKSLTSEASAAIGIAGGVAATVHVDSSREVTTEAEEFFYKPSARMVRYFGESGGNIRCKLGCSNSLGVVKIHFNWEFPVVDGNRYFGFFDEGSKVTFTMFDGKTVDLVMGDESSMKRYERHNYSAISNSSQPLTKEQLGAFIAQPVRKMEVQWRKKPEEYEIEKTRLLMDTLPTVF